MSEPTLGSDHLLPFEKGAASPADEGASFEDLAGALLGEAPTAADDAEPVEAEADTDEVDEIEATDAEESESDDTPDSDEEPEAPPTYRVRVGGEELEVPLPELLAGYSRQADYTRKTTEVANQRKALDAEAVQIRDQYAQRLGALETALAAQMPKEPDWETLRRENPTEFAALKVEYREKQEQLASVRAEADRVRGEQERDHHERMVSHVRAESEKLIAAIPEWKDETKASTEKGQLVEYAASYGMDGEYLDAVTDHRFVLLLRKAMLFDQMQTKGKEAIREKVATAQVLKPGGRVETKKKGQRTEVQRKAERLDRSGRVDDAAALFEHLFEG